MVRAYGLYYRHMSLHVIHQWNYWIWLQTHKGEGFLSLPLQVTGTRYHFTCVCAKNSVKITFANFSLAICLLIKYRQIQQLVSLITRLNWGLIQKIWPQILLYQANQSINALYHGSSHFILHPIFHAHGNMVMRLITDFYRWTLQTSCHNEQSPRFTQSMCFGTTGHYYY